jgi:hypothetical protein
MIQIIQKNYTTDLEKKSRTKGWKINKEMFEFFLDKKQFDLLPNAIELVETLKKHTRKKTKGKVHYNSMLNTLKCPNHLSMLNILS